jgi:hypothetical protein
VGGDAATDHAVKIAIVFAPDPDLGPDPLDEAKEPRRLGIFIDSDSEDVILIHRKYGEQYDGGYRTELFSSGIWENVQLEQVIEAVEALGELG